MVYKPVFGQNTSVFENVYPRSNVVLRVAGYLWMNKKGRMGYLLSWAKHLVNNFQIVSWGNEPRNYIRGKDSIIFNKHYFKSDFFFNFKGNMWKK